MTNAAIIEEAKVQLMREGKIGTTGRMFRKIACFFSKSQVELMEVTA